ncbi:acyltransferase family protein [Cryobacterium roopkundense]|uniref:Peptidoglycan/LPS O-acetylase OafA/YrhL n=1 Tax=Cryobacterium roopkundense TaxID=1001240 RepID=A0A7W8ZYC5_9MICO|nr:acyltransferase [Cryobacterium roopkundense]MBB5642483.1 peptidoglycan/LPS O-acetylase OafA/YrhL [Cryobacterium roopkundense]
MLGTRFDPRRNSLNALRLLLAACVIISHSWIVAGFGYPPALAGTDLGMFAVAGFFAISGYLIAGSRLSTPSLTRFLVNRALRIYPAFLVVLVVTAVVFAPVSALLGGGAVEWSSAARYVFGNASLHITQWGIDGTLQTAGTPNWNAPLWSLVFEALCYLGVGVLASVVPRRAFAPASVTLFVALTAGTLLTLSPATPTFAVNLLAMATFFFAGVVLYILRQRMPLAAPLALVAASFMVLITALGLFKPLAAFPLAYLLLYLSVVLPLRGVGARNDVSYGLYVYGFPVQQLLFLGLNGLFGSTAVPVGVFAVLSLVAALPFAVASWFVVERPALALKSPRGGRVAGPRPALAPADGL